MVWIHSLAVVSSNAPVSLSNPISKSCLRWAYLSLIQTITPWTAVCRPT